MELEGVHSSEISRVYPSHYRSHTMVDYSDGSTFGTRITFHDYAFNSDELLVPAAAPINTNGHSCVNTAGCEHFGFSLNSGNQPTAARYYWLDTNYDRIGTTPIAVPTPTWSYAPPAVPGGAPVVRAEIVVPEPVEVPVQRPDSIWVKIYKTELERAVDLDELISNGGIVPENAGELETEWELLEGGKMNFSEAQVGDGMEAVIRRYEFFEYTGPYDVEHQPTTLFLDTDLPAPPDGELGDFIGANMVAANLAAVPEPSAAALSGCGTMLLLAIAIRKRQKRAATR